jgi:cell division septum initiation protein DivIVA
VNQVYKAYAIYVKDNLILNDKVHRLRAELHKKTKKKALPKRQIEREEGISVSEAYTQGIRILHKIEGGVVVSEAPTRRGVETSDTTKRR